MSWQPGDRLQLVHMDRDPDPLPDGATGTVVYVHPWPADNSVQLTVTWDPPHARRRLAVVVPPDRVKRLRKPRRQPPQLVRSCPPWSGATPRGGTYIPGTKPGLLFCLRCQRHVAAKGIESHEIVNRHLHPKTGGGK